MILYGRNLSPYTRRVAIWLTLQGRRFEQRALALTEPADFAALVAISPLGRVPVLETQEGARLVESWAICDWLDDSAPAGRRLVPESGPARRNALQRIAAAQAATDKCVALVYDRNRRPEAFHYTPWIARIIGQIDGALATLDAAAPSEGWLGGAAPDGSDVTLACLSDFAALMHPDLMEGRYPRLAAHAARANEHPAFAATRP
jgi:glutathione S-transferase